MLRFKNLGSGSTGNATLVAASHDGDSTCLLIDCGLGLKVLDDRLARAGLLASQLSGIFITHEHSDHIGSARALALRERLPVWMSRGTYAAMNTPDFDGLLRLACDGVALDFPGLQLMPFSVPHDARGPLQLTCSNGLAKLGIATDLGHASSHVMKHLQGCTSLLLEFNHDTDLLAQSSYPVFLKQRISGDHGHLSNATALAIAQNLLPGGLKQLVAAHLSQQNNRPERVLNSLRHLISGGLQVHIASAPEGTDWLDA